MVWLRKSSVNYNHLAVALNRTFTLCMVNRHMTVYYMCVLALYAEHFKNSVHHFFVVKELVINIFNLFMGALICNKIPFKSGHFISAVKRRIRTVPQEPQNISAHTLIVLIYGEKCFSCPALKLIVKFFSA